MINIFICEDQDKQRSRMMRVINDYVMMENLDMELSLSVANPYDLLEYVKENSVSQGLYFLDIHLDADLTGIELAVKIRKYDKRGMIIFVTSDKDLIKLTYKYHVEAIGYIDKEDIKDMEKEVKECIHLAQERLALNKEKMFVFRIDDKVFSESYSNILYFEKSLNNKNKVLMITKNGSFEFYMTLKEIAKVHESFYRVGGSYVFNMDNIQSITINEGKVVMINGLDCFISRKHSVAFAKFMEKWNR